MALNDNNQPARVNVVSPLSDDLIEIIRDGSTFTMYATAFDIAQLAGGGGGGGGGVAFDTGTLANNASIQLSLASAGHIYMVFAMDKANTNVVGQWVIFGTAAINAFISTGCALSIVGGNAITLTNLSGGSIDFIGSVQTIL